MCIIRNLTKIEIINLAKDSSNIREIFKKIGIKSHGSTHYYKIWKSHCNSLNIDAHSYLRNNEKEKRKTITLKQLYLACKNNFCRTHALNSLKLNGSGSNVRWIKRQIVTNNINTDHWIGRLANPNRPKPFEKSDLNKILIKNSTYIGSSSLKKRLLKEKLLIYECYNEKCRITEWLNKKISLQLEHKNGDNADNRIENLELLCPNCHSQTKTFCRPKRSKKQ